MPVKLHPHDKSSVSLCLDRSPLMFSPFSCYPEIPSFILKLKFIRVLLEDYQTDHTCRRALFSQLNRTKLRSQTCVEGLIPWPQTLPLLRAQIAIPLRWPFYFPSKHTCMKNIQELFDSQIDSWYRKGRRLF